MSKYRSFKWSDDRKKMVVLIVLATIFRLFLFYNTPLRFATEQVYDDQMMYNYAKSLSEFRWLGGYNLTTLCKEISFPLFVAVCHWISIPYSLALGMLCIGSAYVFVKATSTLVTSFHVKAVFYILLIYAPIGFSALVAQRTYQLSVRPYATILVISCMIAIFLRRDEKDLWKWSIGAAVSLVFFWFIRGDSIWIMPFVISVILITTGCLLWKKHLLQYGIKKRIFMAFFPVLFLFVAILGISSINYMVYGIFVTNDRSGSNFGELMDCLYTIEDKDAPLTVWCSNKAIEDAVNASPTLKNIEKEILAQEYSWGGGSYKDMEGDMPTWVLRSALNDAGLYENAREMNEFCGQVVKELQAAFKSGKLVRDGYIHIGGVQIQNEYIDNGKYWRDFVKYAIGVAEYKGPIAQVSGASVSTGDVYSIRSWERFFNSFTIYPDIPNGEIGEIIQDPAKADNYKIQICIEKICYIFYRFSGLVNILAIVSFVFITIALFFNKAKHIEMWLPILGIILTFILHVLSVVLFTNFIKSESYVYMYLAGAYPLIQIAKYLSIYQGVVLIKQYYIKKIVKRMQKKGRYNKWIK